MDNDRKIYLISAKMNDEVMYKIGYTKRDVEQRISEFKTGNCSDFDILNIYTPLDHCVTIERSLHNHFNDKKINGEWFDLTQEDIEEFPTLCEKFYNRYHILSTTNTYIQDRGIKFK